MTPAIELAEAGVRLGGGGGRDILSAVNGIILPGEFIGVFGPNPAPPWKVAASAPGRSSPPRTAVTAGDSLGRARPPDATSPQGMLAIAILAGAVMGFFGDRLQRSELAISIVLSLALGVGTLFLTL